MTRIMTVVPPLQPHACAEVRHHLHVCADSPVPTSTISTPSHTSQVISGTTSTCNTINVADVILKAKPTSQIAIADVVVQPEPTLPVAVADGVLKFESPSLVAKTARCSTSR